MSMLAHKTWFNLFFAEFYCGSINHASESMSAVFLLINIQQNLKPIAAGKVAAGTGRLGAEAEKM